MRRTWPFVVALLMTVSVVTGAAGRQEQKAEHAKLLASAKTIFVSLDGPDELRLAAGMELQAWRRLTQVAHREDADLVMSLGREPDAVKALSEFGTDAVEGAAFEATVTDRVSGARLWSTSKGKNWRGSDGQGSWAGRAIVREFAKYVDDMVRRRKK